MIFKTTKVEPKSRTKNFYSFKQKISKKNSENDSTHHSSEECTFQQSLQQIKICTQFEWIGQNQTVFITGSFCQWRNNYQLFPVATNHFKVFLPLSPGEYQYKFIVDGKFEYSKEQPFKNQNGVFTNFIQVTPKPKKQKKTKSTKERKDFPTHTTQNINNHKENPQNVLHDNLIKCPDFYSPQEKDLRKVICPVTYQHCLINELNKNTQMVLTTLRVRNKNVLFCYVKPKYPTNGIINSILKEK